MEFAKEEGGTGHNLSGQMPLTDHEWIFVRPLRATVRAHIFQLNRGPHMEGGTNLNINWEGR